MAATTPLREALNEGISSGNLVDTKIVLYSRRDSSSRVYRPKALYANSSVLKTVPYFEDLLFKDFKEAQAKDFKETIDEDESGDDYGYLSDSDLEDDEIDNALSVKHKIGSKTRSAIPEDEIGCEVHDESIEKGKVVKIPDVAFVTFQAFLMYLYTGAIEFAPFGSEENRRSRSTEIVASPDDKVPRPSPKSIYRLADKYDVPALKNLAINHIRGRLASCDIVEESFSKFAFQYDEIRGLYAEKLASVWMEDSTAESVRTNIKNKIKSFVEGDLNHGTEIVAAFWKIASNDGSDPAPANVSSKTGQPTSPAHWGSVKIALIKSIRKGVFFDRKYWARYSTAGDALKPVYFSSVIMEDKLQKLHKLVKHLKGRNPFANDPKGDANIESDCEEVKDELPDAKPEEEGLTRTVLLTGSFAAWKSLFFYRCTDVISFAPLHSQGADVRLNYILERAEAAAPPPCSPKSIYVLANLLEIPALCGRALADIKGKVTPDNVVDEVFSRVTGSQKEIMDMQCDLLVENFKEPSTIRLVVENIKHIPDGSSSHCADTLNLLLEKAFKAKKQAKKQGEGVELRCTYHGCSLRGKPIPYSSVEANNYYYHCQHNYYMQCIGCGHSRTSNYPSCQGCAKRFI